MLNEATADRIVLWLMDLLPGLRGFIPVVLSDRINLAITLGQIEGRLASEWTRGNDVY